jgi:hypothetical protein
MKYVIRFSSSLRKNKVRDCKGQKTRYLAFSRGKKDNRGYYIIYSLSPRKFENSVEIRDIMLLRLVLLFTDFCDI